METMKYINPVVPFYQNLRTDFIWEISQLVTVP